MSTLLRKYSIYQIVFFKKVISIKSWYILYVSSGGADLFFLPPSRKSCTTH